MFKNIFAESDYISNLYITYINKALFLQECICFEQIIKVFCFFKNTDI